MSKDVFQLAEGERIPFKMTSSRPIPGAKTVVRSSHPASVKVFQDETALPGTIASGHIVGGKEPKSGVLLQATITHPGDVINHSVFVIDVGGGDPPAAPAKPDPEPIVYEIALLRPEKKTPPAPPTPIDKDKKPTDGEDKKPAGKES